jgi:poly-gamma-glutamate synthesis protein (capsule biosynthesis protein)
MKTLTTVAVAIAFLAAQASSRAQQQTISFTLTGQSMIRSDFRVHSPETVTAVAPLLKGDVIFTNFEGTVLEKEQSPRDGRFLTPPGALDALKALGFNLLALSDNHSYDLKVPGIQNTLKEVTARNIAHAGIGNNLKEASAPGYLKTSKGTIALVAMASGLIADGGMATADHPGVNELRIEAGGKPNESTTLLPPQPGNEPKAEDKQRILQSIRDARKSADYVVVYEHNHVFLNRPFQDILNEELPERLVPADWLKRWTHEEIDAGADIIVMHGIPVVHGVEIYKGRPIFYDLGNFVYNVPPIDIQLDEPILWESVIAHATFSGRTLQSITFQPIAMNKIGQGEPDLHDEHDNNLFLQTRGLPKPVTGAQAGYILQRLAEVSRPFGTTVVVKGDVAEIDLKPGSAR